MNIERMTKIRISGISDLAMARGGAALDVDYLGLHLDPRVENAISPLKIADFAQWLQGVKLIAQTHHLSSDKALRFVELLPVYSAEIKLSENSKIDASLWVSSASISDEYTNMVVPHSSILDTETKKDVYVQISINEKENIESFLQRGFHNFDLFVSEEQHQNGVNWDELGELIAQIRSFAK